MNDDHLVSFFLVLRVCSQKLSPGGSQSSVYRRFRSAHGCAESILSGGSKRSADWSMVALLQKTHDPMTRKGLGKSVNRIRSLVVGLIEEASEQEP